MQDSYLSYSQRRSSTPSQREKYNNYTPRKRYMKEQQQFSLYLQNQQHTSKQVSPQFNSNPLRTYRANLSSSKSKNKENAVPQPRQIAYKRQPTDFNYDFSEALGDCTSSINSRPSLRKQKYNQCIEQKGLSRKLNFDNENKDFSNKLNVRLNRQKLIEEQPLTPRKIYRKDDQKDNFLTEKMAILKQKINNLEKMNPRRSNTPRKSRVIQQTKLQYELQNEQKYTPMSSRVVSQRQNQLMSRVSLGRLVQQQQCESEIDVIQDLSYKISSKLQTIIRNFG